MTELVRTYVEKNVSGTWTDISSYVVGDIEIEYLISSNKESVKIASVGRMFVVMNNKDGSFSSNASFHRGTSIRVRTVYDGVSKTRFLGTILRINPDTLEWGDQYSRVEVADWMHFATEQPVTLIQLQENMSIDEAVAYLLTLMDKQPESVTYEDGRETFDFVFDTLKKETRVYTELSKLALSEFAPIYLRAGNVLVVESADTRHGMRELTQVPVSPSNLHAILTDPNGGLILTIEGTNFAILADELFTPNLVSGTVRNRDVEVVDGDMLANRVSAKAYPSRDGDEEILLFQLDRLVNVPTLGKVTVKGTYADPQGGGQIGAKNFAAMVTGTNYVAFDEFGNDISTNLTITPHYGAIGFEHEVSNAGIGGFITKFNIYGIGIFPFNPIEHTENITGSVSSYGVGNLIIEQKYQDSLDAGSRIAETIADDEKEPRMDVKSATFDASNTPELMQASQYIDIGDLVWVSNVKPSVDTYCYVQGKKTVISPAGWIEEKWYLKEMNSLRKGLKPIALRFSGLVASKNGVNFGVHSKHGNGGEHTWALWFYMRTSITTVPLIGKSYTEGANTTNDIFTIGSTQNFHIHRAFIDDSGFLNNGLWTSPTGTLAGMNGAWHHVAMVYDDTYATNDPILYLDGAPLTLHEADTPEGTAVPYGSADLIVGNLNVVGAVYPYNFNGYIKDIRIYDRLLSADEVSQLASDNDNYLLVPDGLVFQAPAVKTEDYGMITGTVLYPDDKLIDNIYGVRGTPSWNFPSGTAYGIKAYDPNF